MIKTPLLTLCVTLTLTSSMRLTQKDKAMMSAPTYDLTILKGLAEEAIKEGEDKHDKKEKDCKSKMGPAS